MLENVQSSDNIKLVSNWESFCNVPQSALRSMAEACFASRWLSRVNVAAGTCITFFHTDCPLTADRRRRKFPLRSHPSYFMLMLFIWSIKCADYGFGENVITIELLLLLLLLRTIGARCTHIKIFLQQRTKSSIIWDDISLCGMCVCVYIRVCMCLSCC